MKKFYIDLENMKKFTFDDPVPVGKYKGKTFREISQIDGKYFDWFFSRVTTLPKYGCNFFYEWDMHEFIMERRRYRSLKNL